MAKIVNKYAVGRVCESSDVHEIQKSIQEISGTSVTRDQFEKLREDLMGINQLRALQRALAA
jgi:hypothetical protein